LPIPVSERCRRARSGAPSRRERQSRTLRSISPNCRCAGDAPISTSELGTWQVVSIATAAVVVVLPDWRERQSRALRGRSRNNSCCQKSRSLPQSRANSSGSNDPRHVTSHQHGAAGGSGTQGGMASVASMTKGALAARGVISLAASLSNWCKAAPTARAASGNGRRATAPWFLMRWRAMVEAGSSKIASTP